MFKYYLSIAIFCVILTIFTILLSDHAVTLATIFMGFAGAFLAISFITSGSESRW
jgi:hypothetical protein